ncbi:MAG: hypothetical protein FWD60_09270, partial [Candidatus Azobacteroides sp.]|nr:hypothetical protein [Candidatus Azobacteroides sp.]
MKKAIVLGLIALLVELTNNVVFGQNYSGGNGSQTNPYLISSKADMETLATAVNNGNDYAGKYFLLTQDLIGENDSISSMIGEYTYEEVHEGIYEVISNPFKGTFDGNNHEIALDISIPPITLAQGVSDYDTYNNVGLFAYTLNATIKNLGVSGYIYSGSYDIDSPLKGKCFVGCIVGKGNGNDIPTNSTIINCYNKANVLIDGYGAGWWSSFGGIAGEGCTITKSYNEGNITSYHSKSSVSLGGIGGGVDATQCFNTGNVLLMGSTSTEAGTTGSPQYAGGIVGFATNGVSDCYNTGDVTVNVVATGQIQALAGGIAGSGHELFNHCYNTGTIKAKGETNVPSFCNAGGIIGEHYYEGKSSNNFSVGDVLCDLNIGTAKAYKIGYLVSGYTGQTIYIENNYASNSSVVQINGETVDATIENKKTGFNGEPTDLVNFKNKEWLSNTLDFDFNNIWTIENDDFPIFQFHEEFNPTNIESIKTIDIKVYPNPVNQYLYVNSDSSIKKIELYNSV